MASDLKFFNGKTGYQKDYGVILEGQVNAFLERVLSNPVKELPMSAIFSTVVAMILNLKRTCPK